MNVIIRQDLPGLMDAIAAAMAENSEMMCTMDAAMGDGDLGLTMKKGFAAAAEEMSRQEETDIGKALAKCAMKMSSAVPSTMGTLMSSGLLQGGKSITGKACIGPDELAAFLEAFAAGIQKRGKCNRGDRTVLDAIGNAADRAKDCLSGNGSATLVEVALAAKNGAQEGLEATRGMTPKFGKAAVHAAKAAGQIDQGAFAGCCLVTAISDFICSH